MIFAKRALVLPLLLALSLSSCRQQTPSPPTSEDQHSSADRTIPVILRADNHRDLAEAFSFYNYDVGTLAKNGVPPLVLEAFPQDFGEIPQIKERKRLFFLSLLPMVLLANEEIRRQRRDALYLCQRLDHGETLTSQEVKRLRQLAHEYRLQTDPIRSEVARVRLLQRVDALPPELVLAQAANESGWGTSRFVHQANNLFGEWTLTPGTGIVPQHRPEGATHEIRRFNSLYASLQSYMNNLNSHRAYKGMRDLRASLRYRGHTLDGLTLAAGLTTYSSRGQAYVEELRAMMRQNALSRFRDVSLRAADDGGSAAATALL